MGRTSCLWLAILLAIAVHHAEAAAWSDLSSAVADRAVADNLGRTARDPAWQRSAEEVLAFAGAPDGWTPQVRTVDAPRAAVAALPNGSLYATRAVVQAVSGDPDQLAFLAATLGALALSSHSPADLRHPLAAAGRVSDQEILDADKTAMLWLARAGLPPLSAGRALKAIENAGYDRLPLAGGAQGPFLAVRRQAAQQAAAELIKAGSEFDFGVMDLVDQDYAGALVRFQTFLEVLPNNDAAWNNVGLCHYHLAIAEMPPQPFLLADAIAQFDTSFMKRSIREPDPEHWQAAKAAYDKALAIQPDRIEALSNYGNLYTVNRQYPEARRMYERALSVNANFAPALNNLGVVTVYLSDGPCPKSAEGLFEQAASLDVGLAEAQYNLGQARIERKIGDPKLPYDRYLALAPRGPKAQEVSNWLQRGGAPEPTAPVLIAAAESALRLWTRVQLALEQSRPALVAMVSTKPDQNRTVPGRDIQVVGWSREGLVVELVENQVSRVVCGRPAQHEATTERGARVGQTRTQLRKLYGDPPAVSKQRPYDIWLYPDSGLGFFLVGDKVCTIFLFEVQRPA